jgi:hypothetical protein
MAKLIFLWPAKNCLSTTTSLCHNSERQAQTLPSLIKNLHLSADPPASFHSLSTPTQSRILKSTLNPLPAPPSGRCRAPAGVSPIAVSFFVRALPAYPCGIFRGYDLASPLPLTQPLFRIVSQNRSRPGLTQRVHSCVPLRYTLRMPHPRRCAAPLAPAPRAGVTRAGVPGCALYIFLHAPHSRALPLAATTKKFLVKG